MKESSFEQQAALQLQQLNYEKLFNYSINNNFLSLKSALTILN